MAVVISWQSHPLPRIHVAMASREQRLAPGLTARDGDSVPPDSANGGQRRAGSPIRDWSRAIAWPPGAHAGMELRRWLQSNTLMGAVARLDAHEGSSCRDGTAGTVRRISGVADQQATHDMDWTRGWPVSKCTDQVWQRGTCVGVLGDPGCDRRLFCESGHRRKRTRTVLDRVRDQHR